MKKENVVDYVFGYGSLINSKSRASTVTNNTNQPTIPAILSHEFGFRREWCFRCPSGFTALGVKAMEDSSSEKLSRRDDMFGVLFPVTSSLSTLDLREHGYYRKEVPLRFITVFQSCLLSSMESNSKLESNMRIWIYVPETGFAIAPDEEYPILQTYVDVCVKGCLDWGGKDLARSFLLSTHGWSEFYLNDAPMSRRPWLHREDYERIDEALSSVQEHVRFDERKHPEEYASQHLTSLRGTWGIPKRKNFVGRETKLVELFEFLNCGGCETTVVELVGIGGVGKSSLAAEYCHRHFGTTYELVGWFRAESQEALAADLRQFAVDMGIVRRKQSSGLDSEDNTVVEAVKQRLSKSRCKWLLIFDNVENIEEALDLLPRGQWIGQHPGPEAVTSTGDYFDAQFSSKEIGGHVIVTSRAVCSLSFAHEQTLRTVSPSVMSSVKTLAIDCFDRAESIRFLEVSITTELEEQLTVQQASAVSEIAERMGDLPLALSMAAAYMSRCDISPQSYLERLRASSGGGLVPTASSDCLNGVVLAVASSMSVSLQRLQNESYTGYDVLLHLGYMSPNGITKELVSEIMKGRKEKCLRRIPNNAIFPIAVLVGCFGTATSLIAARRGMKLVSACSGVVSLAAITAMFLMNRNSLASENMENRNERTVPSEAEVDKVWDLLKQFSFLSVRGPKHLRMAYLHRLQQDVLKCRNDAADVADRLSNNIRAVNELWKFSSSEASSWDACGVLLGHVLHLVENVNSVSDVRLSSEIQELLSRLLINCADYAIVVLSQFETAENLLEEALRCNTLEVLSMARGYHTLGKVLRLRGQFDKAQIALERALVIRQECLSEEKKVADTLHELGVLSLRRREAVEARMYLLKSLQLKRSKGFESTTEAATLHQLAVCAIAANDYDEAEKFLEEVLALERPGCNIFGMSALVGSSIIGTDEKNCSMAISRAATLLLMGRMEARRGRLSLAEERFREAMKIYQEVYGKKRCTQHINVTAVLYQLGRCLIAQHRFDEASVHLSSALAGREIIFGHTDHLDIIQALQAFGEAELCQNRLDQAENAFTREYLMAHRLLLSLKDSNSSAVSSDVLNILTKSMMFALFRLRNIASRRGEEQKAKQLYQQAQQLRKQLEGKQPTHATKQLPKLKKSSATGAPYSELAPAAPNKVAVALFRLRNRLRTQAKTLQKQTCVEGRHSSSLDQILAECENELKILASTTDNDDSLKPFLKLYEEFLEDFNNSGFESGLVTSDDCKALSQWLFKLSDQLRGKLRELGCNVEDE